MIKKFDRFIYEKLGISNDLEDQVESIYQEVNKPENDKKEVFRFVYHNDIGSAFFKLQFGRDKPIYKDGPTLSESCEGYFCVSSVESGQIVALTVTVDSKSNKSTLLHEVKHLDHSMRTKSWKNKEFIKTAKSKTDLMKQTQSVKSIGFILYSYDIDEFEAKYHGYYVDIDEGVSKIIKSMPKEELTKKMVSDIAKYVMKNFSDRTYTWWTSGEIIISNYAIQSDINNIFYNIAKENPEGIMSVDLFKEISRNISNFMRSKLNIYSNKDKELIKKTVQKFEKEINRRRKIFEKKFYRLITLMVDKYATDQA